MSKELTVYTSKELTKASELALNSEQLQFLLKKTPKQHIYQRQAKGGGKWDYVTGTYVKKVLNLMFGWDWSFEVVEHKIDLTLKQAYVLGKLTVNSNGKSIVKMQFGRVDIKFRKQPDKDTGTRLPLDVGNDLKAATTDALKKCASELGIASDVYAPNEFKEIKIVNEEVEIKDPDYERMEILVNEAETQDDIDFARCHVTDKVLIAKLDVKEQLLKKKK